MSKLKLHFRNLFITEAPKVGCVGVHCVDCPLDLPTSGECAMQSDAYARLSKEEKEEVFNRIATSDNVEFIFD